LNSFFFNFKKQIQKHLNPAVYCPSISNEGNAKWERTFANGEVINGKCLNGFQGSASRKCTQSDSIGHWDPISTSCIGICLFLFLFLFFFEMKPELSEYL